MNKKIQEEIQNSRLPPRPGEIKSDKIRNLKESIKNEINQAKNTGFVENTEPDRNSLDRAARPVVKPPPLTNTTGAFDNPRPTDIYNRGVKGGITPLRGRISNIQKQITEENDPKSDVFTGKLQRLQQQMTELQRKREEMPMPKDSDNPKKTKIVRAANSRKMRALQKQIDAMQVVKTKSLPKPDDFEHEKYTNLADKIGYKTCGLNQMDRITFEMTKKSIIDRANRFYSDGAEVAADYLIMMSSVTNGYSSLYGYSFDLTKNRQNLVDQIKKCMIYEGMKGRDMLDHLGNPWVGFGLLMCAPILTRYTHNREIRQNGENPKEIVRKEIAAEMKKKMKKPPSL